MERNAFKYMHHVLLAALAIVVVLGMVSLSRPLQGQSQPPTQPATPQMETKAPSKHHVDEATRTELRNFDEFLDKHPEIAKDLRKDPKLVNDQDFVSKHPELKEWLENHPRAAEELKEHPRAFMHKERKYEKHGKGEEGREKSEKPPQP